MDGAYRICEEHEFETVKKSKQLTWDKDKEGNAITWNQTYDLYVPHGEGPKSTMCLKSRDSRGIGGDWRALKTLEEVNHQIKKGTTKALVVPVPSSANKKTILTNVFNDSCTVVGKEKTIHIFIRRTN